MSTINSIALGDASIPVVVAAGGLERYPASEAQLEVWLSSTQSTEANCAYNEISSLIIRGDLNATILKEAIEKVVLRHSALRSTFSRDGQAVLIHNQVAIAFEHQDLRALAPAEADQAMREVVKNQARTPFDLVQGPLIRFVLQQVSSSEFKLTLTAHHLVMDGWSLSVFCRDLGHYYDVLLGVDRPALPPANDYCQYAATMKAHLDSDAGKSDEAFWLEQFSENIPVLDLPIESSRPSLRTYSGDRCDHVLSKELVEKVRVLGAKSGCSLFNAMLAAFNAYLSRISDSNDFCVGIPTAGQAALDHPELMGHCVNTMPLRTQVEPEQSFNDYMKSTRNSLLDAFDHQCYSYGSLLRKLAPPRDPARPPMLSVSFNLDPMIDAKEIGFSGLDVEISIEPRSFENFEWFVNGVIRKDQSVELQVQYNTDLFSAEMMKFYLEGFEAFLAGVVDNPTAKIAEIHTMSVPQRQKVLVDWNSTKLNYPTQETLQGEFSRQAAATPDKTAIAFQNEQLTYAEVETQSNQLARYLSDQGVMPGDLVGICVERNSQMLVTLFGILKAGAGYVPLDPAYPTDRLHYMCEHSELKLVVTQSSLLDRVAAFGKPCLAIDESAKAIQQMAGDSLGLLGDPTDVCYVIYTSGSTGKPKGVQVPHGAVVNLLYSMREKPGFTAEDSVLAVTTLSFDIAVLELYLPTIFGGTVVLADSATAADGDKLASEIEARKISVMQATPATWRMLIQSGWQGRKGLKVLCGGEPMPQDLVAPLLERCDELWNMYGPTETTVWSAAFRITSAIEPILIGKPIGNTQIFILDSNGREVPAGCEGEIFIGGAGVTFGYLHQPEMTNERFVRNRYRNPFESYVSDRLYRTGDLGRYCLDGNIQFLRRNDKQVKVRGFRIELGEVEQAIKSHPHVNNNVVVVREDSPGDVRLVAYTVLATSQSLSAGQLREHLRKSLPYYMVPQHFVELDSMPQTNNGKIDYKALPQPQVESVELAQEEGLLPDSATEKYLAGVWQEVLQIDDVRKNDTFFDIGGHSLLVMQVITTVHEKTGIKLSPQDFLISTLEQIADKFSDAFQLCDGFDERAAANLGQSHGSSEQNSGETSFQLTEAMEGHGESGSANEDQSPAGVFRKLKGFWK